MDNPQFTRGYIRDDGYLFQKYRIIDGKQFAVFMSPKASFRERMQTVLNNARKRAKEYNLEIDIDVDYLLQIYPENNMCPVLGIEMCFRNEGITGPTNNSPSLDRIVPALGYVKGNVIFVSTLANQIKTCATPDQIRRVWEFYSNIG